MPVLHSRTISQVWLPLRGGHLTTGQHLVCWRLQTHYVSSVRGATAALPQAKLVVAAQEQQAAEIAEIRGDVIKVRRCPRRASAALPAMQGTCGCGGGGESSAQRSQVSLTITVKDLVRLFCTTTVSVEGGPATRGEGNQACTVYPVERVLTGASFRGVPVHLTLCFPALGMCHS